jgi:tRNA pseudouridine55 synthase
MKEPIPENILLIDKPKGITSFDVIRLLRKKLGIKKMGHAGTLDPLATGLLIIGVGPGTKKLKNFIKLPKTYDTQVILGIRTKTGDLEGDILEEKEVKTIDFHHLALILESLTGTLTLPVPLYSAVKVDGEPLYKRARRGEDITPPNKKMSVTGIFLKDHYPMDQYYILELIMDVSSGTYVRSIAEEIGRQLDVPATAGQIRRTRIGPYQVEDAQTIDLE